MNLSADELSEREISRYSRQLILRDWDTHVQTALRKVSVELPCSLPSAARYLAAAGAGTLYISYANPKLEKQAQLLAAEVQALNSDISSVPLSASTAADVDYRILFNSPENPQTSPTPCILLSILTQESPQKICLSSSQKSSEVLLEYQLCAHKHLGQELFAGISAAMMLLYWHLEQFRQKKN